MYHEVSSNIHPTDQPTSNKACSDYNMDTTEKPNFSMDQVSGIGASVASEIAERFDEFQIPNLLWGRLALGLVGKFQRDDEVEFIIPDDLIARAADIVTERTGFKPCVDTACRARHHRLRPVPFAHFHTVKEGFHFTAYTIICLHKKSDLIWWLPDLEPGPPAKHHKHLTLSNDRHLPVRNFISGGSCGPWNNNLPVKILTPHAFTEAVLMLFCRDWGEPNCHDLEWKAMLHGLFEWKPGFFARPYKVLQPRLQKCWDEMRKCDEKGEYIWGPVRELRKELAAENKLPPPPVAAGDE